MILVNCAVEENDPTQAVLDTSANVNCISQKHIGERSKRMEFLFGRIVQGNYTVKEFYSKLKECNLSKDYPEGLLRNLFLGGLSSENKIKVLMDDLQALALDEILERLEQ